MGDEMKSYTHVGLVLDASGSMSGLRHSTVRTIKEFFNSLKSDTDRVVVDLWQFDDEVKHLIDSVDVSTGSSKAIEGYRTGGCTALYDAVCTRIDQLGAKFSAMDELSRPDAVVFAILTDGYENASRKFTANDVKSRIELQSGTYSWDFRFLAANQDAVLAGSELGLGSDSCFDMDATPDGIMESSSRVSNFVCSSVRSKARLARMKKLSSLKTLDNLFVNTCGD